MDDDEKGNAFSIDERYIAALVILRSLATDKKNKKIHDELELVSANYVALLAQRKKYHELERRFEAVSGFLGLR